MIYLSLPNLSVVQATGRVWSSIWPYYARGLRKCFYDMVNLANHLFISQLSHLICASPKECCDPTEKDADTCRLCKPYVTPLEDWSNSVCMSTFNDDIGTLDKFSELANVQLQNFLICLEMFFAAVAHRYAGSHCALGGAADLSGTRMILILPGEWHCAPQDGVFVYSIQKRYQAIYDGWRP